MTRIDKKRLDTRRPWLDVECEELADRGGCADADE